MAVGIIPVYPCFCWLISVALSHLSHLYFEGRQDAQGNSPGTAWPWGGAGGCRQAFGFFARKR